MQVINRAYVGIPSFMRARVSEAPEDLARAAVAVLGVPFDEGSPFLPGSRMGPRAIREHSLRFPAGGLYDPDTGETFLARELNEGLLLDVGDVDVRPANAARTFEITTARVRAILDSGAFPVVLGGDHSITYPIFDAFDRPTHVLQFDAHQDYSEIDEDLQHTNSHAFRHITAMDTCLGLAQVGIRVCAPPAPMWTSSARRAIGSWPCARHASLVPRASPGCCRRARRSMSRSMSMRWTCR